MTHHLWETLPSVDLAQVCIFRNSVRRALKGISQALERLEGGQAGAAGTVQVCRAVTTVVGQIAQSVHRLQQVSQDLTCPSHHLNDVLQFTFHHLHAQLVAGEDLTNSAAACCYLT